MVKKVVKKEKVNFEIAAYVLGILSIIQIIFSPFSSVIIGIVGIVLSKKQKTPLSEKARKLNIIGLVLGAILSLLAVVILLLNPPQLAGL